MKKILFPLASLFLSYQFYQLVLILQMGGVKDFILIADVAFAFFIALCGTGIFAFIGFAYPTHKMLDKSYYRLKDPDSLKRWYHRLGVTYFQKALMLAFWGTKKNRKKYFNGTRSGIENFAYQTYQSEFGHLGALVLIGLVNSYIVTLGYWRIASILLIINLIGNFYPIILQRYHRIRIEKYLS